MFDFGKNWQEFSEDSLDDERFLEVQKSVGDLVGVERIENKTFLDIGCGSGIFAISAKKLGASKVVGFDVLKSSVESAKANKDKFAKDESIDFFEQSILKEGYDQFGKFDVIYSWGVLHHTGNMWKAIKNAMELVDKNGVFVIAIYNKHWTSPVWRIIKWLYNKSPKFFKLIMIWIFYVVIAAAKFLVTGKNPFKKKKRGMSFYYDVVDWVGGYPYEYASKKELVDFFEKNNFKLEKFVKAEVPTGCNEFVFKKK